MNDEGSIDLVLKWLLKLWEQGRHLFSN